MAASLLNEQPDCTPCWENVGDQMHTAYAETTTGNQLLNEAYKALPCAPEGLNMFMNTCCTSNMKHTN